MSETVTKRISDAPDAGLFDPSWRIPIAVSGSDGAFSTSAAEFLNATKKGTFDRVDTSVLNVTDVMTGNGVANYMASPPPIGTGVPNLGVFKALWIRGAYVFDGSPYSTAASPLSMSLNLSGRTQATGNVAGFDVMKWATTGDTVDARPSTSLRLIDVLHQFGGPGTTGFRQAMQVRISQLGPTDNRLIINGGMPADFGMQAMSLSSIGSFNEGGTPQLTRGHNFGFGVYAALANSGDNGDGTHGATNWVSNVGCEWDVVAQAGTSVLRQMGMSIVHLLGHAVQGGLDDAGILFADQGHTDNPALFGWRNLLQIGSALGQDPLGPGCGMMQWHVPSHPLEKRPQADWGIDIALAPISGPAFASRDFAVRSGAVAIFQSLINQTANGIAIDVPNYIIGLGALVPGTSTDGIEVGDWFCDAATGLIVSVTSVTNDDDAFVTGVQIERVGYARSNPGTVTVSNLNTFIGGSFDVSVTATLHPGLSLNPTGQRIGFNGALPIAKPTLSGSCTTNTAAVLKAIAALLGSYGLATDTTTA